MPQRIEVPGMGIVEFPDGMSDDQIAEAIERNMPAAQSKPAGPQKPELMQRMQNMAAGAVRGAGSIGATLMAPQDMLQDAFERMLTGKDRTQLGLSNLVTGKPAALSRNQQRRQDMTNALQSMGADASSVPFQVGKVGTEIAGTLGVGPALAGVAAPVAGARAAPLLEAVRTAGMRAGGLQGLPGMATRAAGGAITGGASAGLLDPSQVAEGAIISAVAPSVIQAAGKLGTAAGNVVRGPAQSPDLTQAVKAARAQGYVIPPTQAKPSLANRILEGFSGKITTGQNASARNQAITNKLAAESLGLPGDTKLTADVLKSVRDQAGQAYDALGSAGVITPSQTYMQALDRIAQPFKTAAQGFPGAKPSPVLELVDSLKSPSFDASAAIAKIKELRSGADDAFRAGSSDVGRASRAAAKALEDAIEEHLQRTGATQMLDEFRQARQLIAKTYTVEKALNPTTGTVDARKIGQQITKGKPVTGPMREAGEFANRFPKAAQPVEGMGSLPQSSPLDWALGGIMSSATANPLMLATVAARPAARAMTLSPLVQNRLAQQPNALSALMLPDLQQLLLRAGPALAADR